MSLRSSLLRQCRTLQLSYRQPVTSQRIIRPYLLSQRQFHFYPSARQEKTPDSPAENAAPEEKPAETQTPTENAPSAENGAQTTAETTAKEPPSAPPKRDIDPKAQELAELKVFWLELRDLTSG